MEKEKLELFLAELTKISIDHGVGITGDPVLFVLEDDDKDRVYTCNDESNLHFE
jgi:hypothetical protein